MSTERWTTVLAEAARSRTEFHVPGMAIGILADGEVQTGGVGVTDPRAPLDVDGQTLFQIGSISKTFAGTLAALLAQRGKLDLDAPVRDYLPTFQVADAEATAKVTTRDLLSHRAGWLGDYFEMNNPSLQNATERMRWQPQTYPLGKFWSYNNASFYVAGHLLEVVAGKPYALAIKQEFLDPLGMKDTGYRLTDLLTAKVAMGFTAVYEEGQEAKPGRWYGVGAVDAVGGLSSTVSDLLRWAKFFIDGKNDAGEEMLTAESLATLRELRVPGAVSNFNSLAWFTRDLDGVRVMGHGGSMIYQQSSFQIAPEKGFAFVALTNSERGSESITPVWKTAVQTYLGVSEKDLAKVEAPQETLESYVGTYQGALSTYTLYLEDGVLWLRAVHSDESASAESSPQPPPTRLSLTERADTLVALDPPFKDNLSEILRDDAGAVAWLRTGGRITKKV